MKHYKGKLFDYFSTGRVSHFYVWTGEEKPNHSDWANHVMITESDVMEVSSPDRSERVIIHYFPKQMTDLKDVLKKKGLEVWNKAVKENWDIELIKFVYERNPH